MKRVVSWSRRWPRDLLAVAGLRAWRPSRSRKSAVQCALYNALVRWQKRYAPPIRWLRNRVCASFLDVAKPYLPPTDAELLLAIRRVEKVARQLEEA